MTNKCSYLLHWQVNDDRERAMEEMSSLLSNSILVRFEKVDQLTGSQVNWSTDQPAIYNSATILSGWPVYTCRTSCKAGKRQQ